MNELVKARVRSAAAQNAEDTKSVLREVIQEIALLGLWRGKFFEKAAFYGGTALRILYKLNRFSEDLDFTLLVPDSEFVFDKYCRYVCTELEAFGFDAEVSPKIKKKQTAMESAFIRADTATHLLRVGSRFSAVKGELLKVKLELDTSSPQGFQTEAKPFFWPQPFTVRVCDLPSLFSGKLHATFCRDYKHNVKGRDWFDLLWYIGRNTQPNWTYLESKLRDSGHWHSESFNSQMFITWAKKRIVKIDFEAAKRDVKRFLPDPRVLDGWTPDLFIAALDRL